MRRLHLTAAASVFALAAALPGAANAACCVAYDYGDAQTHEENVKRDAAENKKQVIDHFTTEIDALELAIIEALKKMTGQLSGNLKEQVAAEGNMKTVEDNRRVVGRVEDVRFQGVQEAASASSTCNVITQNRASAASDIFLGQLREQLAEEQLAWDLGQAETSGAGPEAAAAARADKHCEYATEGDVKAGLCQSVGDDSMANLDLNASRTIFKDGTLSEAERKAASLFIINAYNPDPAGGVPEGFANDARGRAAMAERQKVAARRSIAADAAWVSYTRRTPMNVGEGGAVDKGDKLQKWAEDTAKLVYGYNPEGENFPNGVGWHDVMKLRARSWFHNPNWMHQVSEKNNPAQNIKEMVILQSFAIYQNWELYALLEKLTGTLAAQAAMSAGEPQVDTK